MWKNKTKIPLVEIIKDKLGTFKLYLQDFPYKNSTLFKNPHSFILPLNITMNNNILDFKTQIETNPDNSLTFKTLGVPYKYINDTTFIRKDDNTFESDDPEYGPEINKPYIKNTKTKDIVIMFNSQTLNSFLDAYGRKYTNIYLNGELLFSYRIQISLHWNEHYIENINPKYKNNVLYSKEFNEVYSYGLSYIYFYFSELDKIEIKAVPQQDSREFSVKYNLNIRYLDINDGNYQEINSIPYSVVLVNNK